MNRHNGTNMMFNISIDIIKTSSVDRPEILHIISNILIIRRNISSQFFRTHNKSRVTKSNRGMQPIINGMQMTKRTYNDGNSGMISSTIYLSNRVRDHLILFIFQLLYLHIQDTRVIARCRKVWDMHRSSCHIRRRGFSHSNNMFVNSRVRNTRANILGFTHRSG